MLNVYGVKEHPHMPYVADPICKHLQPNSDLKAGKLKFYL